MATQDEMLRFIHQKDKSTLSKRYTPAQLQAAFKALGGGGGGATQAPQTPMAPQAPVVPYEVAPQPPTTTPGTTEQQPGTAPLPGQGILPSDLPDVALKDFGQTATNAAAMNLEGSQLGTAFTPNLNPRTSSGDLIGDRKRVEEALFQSLTRNMGADKAREEEATRQRLANQGIAFSADPNSRYQQELKGLNDRYDTLQSNAMQNATILGGQEWERGVGIGETIRGNQLSEQSGIRNQQLSELGGLTGLDQLGQELALKKKLTAAQIAAMKRQGSSGAPAQESSPFNSGTPPGLSSF